LSCLEVKAASRAHRYPAPSSRDAELRNQIYEFATEDANDTRYALRINMPLIDPWEENNWNFFGLLYVCKQIREEYRPLWLHDLSISGTIQAIRCFSSAFLPRPKDLQHSPKRVQIEWDRGNDDRSGSEHDLTHLLRMRAYNSGVHFEFIPYEFAGGNLPPIHPCWYCITVHDQELSRFRLGAQHFINPYEEAGCFCPPDDLVSNEDYEPYMYAMMTQTKLLLGFICNGNTKWQQDIREEHITIQCRLARHDEPVTFRILCTGRYANTNTKGDTADLADVAWELLDSWGMFEFSALQDMSFVVAFKNEQTRWRGGYEVVSSEVREVQITMRRPWQL
jgi:hypothetical protein